MAENGEDDPTARGCLSAGALAVYGGTAWVGCLVGGALIGLAIGLDSPPEGVVAGRQAGISSALPEVVVSTCVLLAVAYALFFWLLMRD